jgi:PAS domain S-box-containing protein
MQEGFALHQIICDDEGEPVDYRFLEINPAFERLTGLSRDNVIGRTLLELMPQSEPHWIKTYGRVALTGQPTEFEEYSRELERYFRVRAFSPKRGKFGVIFSDETERRRSEEALRLLNEELEERVRQRTSEYEEINRELESFNYSVSHDLRAPLRHIDGYTTIFMDEFGDQVPPEGKAYLDRITRATRRMGTLIDALLELSRINRSSLHLADVNLSQVAAEVVALLRESSPGRRVDVSIEPDLHVQGDPQMFRVILDNLMGNAWKYSAKVDTAEIAIGSREMDGERVFFVRDNGAGFDMAYADKLFGPFQRLHGADEFEGTGIGLATVQRLIHRHGGRVWAEGEPGRGATFYFTVGEVAPCR